MRYDPMRTNVKILCADDLGNGSGWSCRDVQGSLYRYPAIARQLSGAHRISGDGKKSAQVQTPHRAGVNLTGLACRLEQTIAPRPPDTWLTVAGMADEDFLCAKTAKLRTQVRLPVAARIMVVRRADGW